MIPHQRINFRFSVKELENHRHSVIVKHDGVERVYSKSDYGLHYATAVRNAIQRDSEYLGLEWFNSLPELKKRISKKGKTVLFSIDKL